MAISLGGFSGGGGGGGDVTSVNGDTGAVIVSLDSATDQGATTTNSITVGGLSVGTAYSLPTADGTANQSLVTDGSGNLSFTTLDPTGGLEYKGTFNATAGTPSLANAEQGDYYKIDTAGTIYGQTWAVGDSLLINADMSGTITNSKIDKLDNTESVTSVNSQTGAVNLGAGDLSDVTITSAASGEVLKYNGTNWVDANVDYTEVTNTPTNVSTFTNDANYVASGDNVSVLSNDANYVASGDNVSVLTNDAGYLTDITGESIGDLSDVTVTTPSNGQVLSYNGTNWVNSASSAGSLSGLSDTTIGTPVNGEVLKYNGTAWVDANIDYTEITNTPTNVSTFTNDANYVASGDNVSELTNDAGYLTSIPTASHSTAGILETATNAEATNATANDKILTPANLSHIDLSTFDNDSGFISDITGESIGDLSDVTVTTPSNGQVLSYNGTNWVNSASSAGSLSGLSDTTIGTPVNGEVLKYNGTAWVDAQLAYSELSGTPTNVSTFTNDANYVASGDNVSVLTNDSGYITDITSENLGDLSDVTITASATGEYIRYNGSAWVDSALSVVDDTTPQLGGNLDTNSNEIITASNANLVLRPNGTGHVFLGGNTNPAELRLYCESADAHYVGFKSPTHAQLSGSQVWRLPLADATTSGDALVSDGAGNLSFTTISGGGGGYTFSAISSATTAQISYHYSCDTSGGAFTLTLPALSGVTAGQEIRVKLATAGNDLTIARTGSDTIDGLTSFTLSTAKSSITLVANTSGTDWEIV